MAKKSKRQPTMAEMARASERRQRAEQDPWFGKRRKAGEMGNKHSKAAKSKRACRGKVAY